MILQKRLRIHEMQKPARSGLVQDDDPRRVALHLRSRSVRITAVFATLLVCEHEIERRETNEHVDKPLEPRNRTEEHVNDVPTTCADETPVEAADPDEYGRYRVKCFHVD